MARSATSGQTVSSRTYNRIGNMSTRVEQGNTTNYTYDANHKHAVAQAGSNYFCYDSNGNMTRRNAARSSCASGGDTMSYDVENRMTSMVTGAGVTNLRILETVRAFRARSSGAAQRITDVSSHIAPIESWGV